MKLFKSRHQELEPDEDFGIEGERALSSVNKAVKLQNKITNVAIMGGAFALAFVFLYKYYADVYQDYKKAEAPKIDITRTAAAGALPPLTMPDPVPVKESTSIVPSDTLPPLQQSTSPGVTATMTPSGQVPLKTAAELVRERRMKREVRFNLDSNVASEAGSGLNDDSVSHVDTGSAARLATTATSHSSASSSVRPGGFTASRAYILPDPTLTLTRGTAVPCTLIPAIDTTLTGIVTCVTGEDATGADNKVSLMDRGTLCTGQQSGGVVRGQRRVGIIWQVCETPQHVRVPLDSGATDSLGRPGIPGAVDNHFWDRFGAAVALSLISDIGPYLVATRQSGSNSTTVSFPTVTGPQAVMSEVLKSTVDIPPTITAPQGAQVLIYLSGDVDFRDVYQLARVK
jgi:type IV secretion system protein VirB10